VGVEEVLLRAPGMQHDVDAKPLAVRNGIAIVADAQTTGHYRLSWTTPQPGERIVPVNLTSSAESDLQREPTQTDKGALAVSDAGDKPQRRRDYSWLLALLALLLIAADVWWQTRKPRAVSLGSGKPRLPSRRPTKARGA